MFLQILADQLEELDEQTNALNAQHRFMRQPSPHLGPGPPPRAPHNVSMGVIDHQIRSGSTHTVMSFLFIGSQV